MDETGDPDHVSPEEAAELEAELEAEYQRIMFDLADGGALKGDDRVVVAWKIRQQRKALRITQKELAELTGVPLGTIKYLDSGGTPQAMTLLALLDGLHNYVAEADQVTVYHRQRPAAVRVQVQVNVNELESLGPHLDPIFLALDPSRRAAAFYKLVTVLSEELRQQQEAPADGDL